MKTIPDKKLIESAYERIIEQKLFKRSSLQERILSFLINQAIEQSDVNEHTIGFELFKDKYSADQNDSKVRVYVHYLRKKLEEYYNGVGENETLRFKIEKGQYNVVFVTGDSIKKLREKKNSRLEFSIEKRTIIIVFFALILGCAAFVFSTSKPTYCWTPFIKSKKPLLCVLADHYTVQNKTESGRRVYSIFSDIKNDEEFHLYKDEHPNLLMNIGDFTLLSRVGPLGLKRVSDWLYKHDCLFELGLESDLSYNDYVSHNVVYIGQSKTMSVSEAIFLKGSKEFQLLRNGFIHTRHNVMNRYFTNHGKNSAVEYAMVSFQQLENGNNALFFVSNNDIGALATLKKFTSEEELAKFYKLLPSEHSQFYALFRVHGLKRTDFGCELVALEVVGE